MAWIWRTSVPMMPSGVPLGATMPNQVLISNAGRPASAEVGISGAAAQALGLRNGEHTHRSRSHVAAHDAESDEDHLHLSREEVGERRAGAAVVHGGEAHLGRLPEKLAG